MKVSPHTGEIQFSIKEYRKFMPLGKIALVPTMGYLHEGHRKLIREARKQGDFVAVSIFVNPLQFNKQEDLDHYPRNPERDLEMCEKEGVDLVFMPEKKDLFPHGEPALHLSMPDLTNTLCGPGRPGHFEGVLYIVARFFNLFQPDLAFFGKKDYQQYRVIERMVKDLGYPIRIMGVPTVREENGLALSSRNARLSEEGKEQASLIHRGMKLGEKSFREGERNPSVIVGIVSDVIESGSKNSVEYVEIVDPVTLQPLTTLEGRDVFLLAAAVECEGIRLIDNLEATLSD